MSKIKVLLVDDQVLFVKSLEIVLQTQARNLEVTGIAYDGQTALDLIDKKKPDVVFMDVRMPQLDGVQSTKIIKEKYPDVHVVVLTTFDDDDYVVDALSFGASGYLLKDVSPEEIIASATAVCQGGVMISPQVAAKLVHKLEDATDLAQISEDPLNASKLFDLSAREQEILSLIGKDYSNREIADLLFIASQTVRNHISVIYSKLGVHDRFHAIRLAREAGLVSSKPDSK